ncbi:MAG: HD domain-containing protein [Firmicutes bacterium]|nr:HD domain-containing protein [Bacillota bacterium]
MAHSRRVAHIAYHLGKALTLERNQLNELVLSAFLHDIGVMTNLEQLALADLEPKRSQVAPHCQAGYNLLQGTQVFGWLAQNVLEHHDYHSPDLRIIPAILHVADRVDILLDKSTYSLNQVDSLLHYFSLKSGYIFNPNVVDALRGLGEVPSFWLDLEFGNYTFFDAEDNFGRVLTIDELEEMAQLVTQLVDAKSPFTHRHSQAVTRVVAYLGTKLNMSKEDVRLIKIAGLLHDIGKLAVPDEILLHPGGLTRAQRLVMKQHTYHSYHLIRCIGSGTERLAGWAAFHHEKLNGTGYPFRLSAPDLDREARLMAVADMTESLLETRPYRLGMSQDKVRQILYNNVNAGHIDPELTDLAIAYLDDIEEIVHACQKSA